MPLICYAFECWHHFVPGGEKLHNFCNVAYMDGAWAIGKRDMYHYYLCGNFYRVDWAMPQTHNGYRLC